MLPYSNNIKQFFYNKLMSEGKYEWFSTFTTKTQVNDKQIDILYSMFFKWLKRLQVSLKSKYKDTEIIYAFVIEKGKLSNFNHVHALIKTSEGHLLKDCNDRKKWELRWKKINIDNIRGGSSKILPFDTENRQYILKQLDKDAPFFMGNWL